jgi:hypothetical protein
MEKHNHANIPETGFVAQKNDFVEDRRLVRFNQGAIFSFSEFSIFQFIAGHAIKLETEDGNNYDETRLLSKLSIMNMELRWGANNEILLERKEVTILKGWLDLRMRHCEIERDQRVELTDSEASRNVKSVLENEPLPYPDRNQKFNADTYIGMKYLMMELREWLFGEILD